MKAGLAMLTPLCICSRCPSYPGEKDPRVYCARGASAKPITQKGCICSNCPIQKMLRMKNMYYCYSGSNQQQKKEKS